VNDAIKILDNKIAELTPKISRASSNQFDILPVETLARPIKQQNVKVISELEKIRDKASIFWQEHINKLKNV
jgi:hypothetical protein